MRRNLIKDIDAGKKLSILIILTLLLASITVFWVTQPVKATWADGNYMYKQPITIDHTKVGSTLTNFPVLVKILANSTLDDRVTNENGYDIKFYASDDTTQLAHEIEIYNETGGNGNLIAWVNVTSISSSTDTVFYMYYGYAGQTTPTWNPTGVWDSNYVGVYHLNATTGSQCWDSTANKNHGTYIGNLPRVNYSTGVIGNGQGFDGNGDYISLPSGAYSTSTAQATITTWAKEDQITDSSHDMYNWAEATGAHCTNKMVGYFGDDNENSYMYEDAWVWDKTDGNTRTTSPCMLTHMFDGSSNALYKNADLVGGAYSVGSAATGTSGKTYTATQFYIGTSRTAITSWMNGWMDEFRFSKIKRSVDYVQATYNSTSSTVTFLTLGTVEVNVDTTISLILANNLFTFQGEQGNTTYANSSGINLETGEFNISYDETQVEYIRINFTENLHTNITNSHISVQFNVQNSSWTNDWFTLSDGANTIWLNSTTWTDTAYTIGTNPFPIQTDTSIWWRCKLTIPTEIGNETYTNTDFITWDAGYYDYE